MKCFNHRELDAIAVCKHCGRGTCSDCAVEVCSSMACRSRCEAEVRAGFDMVARASSAMEKGNANHYKVAVFVGLMGLIMGGFAFTIKREDSHAWVVFLLFAVVFLLKAGMSVHSARRLQQRD
jgi:hypothetical protein